MFEHVAVAPPDAIFGLVEAFRRDPNPDKIDLTVGLYRNDDGRTPVLTAVKRAEEALLAHESTKAYLPIAGLARFAAVVERLLFGEDHAVLGAGRVMTAQAPGGTGALRVAGELLRKLRPETTVWLSEPTWVNHRSVFGAAGLPTRGYPYLDRKANALAWDGMTATLADLAPGDVVVLQGCCHNPTGVDPDSGQWKRLADLLAERDAIPLIDIAYQGFGAEPPEDAAGVRILAARLPELMVCTSFSKNFSLYNERVGALTVVARTSEHAAAVLSQVKICIRSNYSNPPAHGGTLVAAILEEAELERLWLEELATMRSRIRDMRTRLAAGLDARGVELSPQGNGFIVRQKGMFSYSGLAPEQVELLRTRHAIYLVGSGRISVAGMNTSNMDRLCDAIADVC